MLFNEEMCVITSEIGTSNQQHAAVIELSETTKYARNASAMEYLIQHHFVETISAILGARVRAIIFQQTSSHACILDQIVELACLER